MFCIMSDFNYRRVDWVNVLGNLESEDFLKVIQDFFSQAGSYRAYLGDNVLDLVLTSNGNTIRDIQVGEELGNAGSPHFTIAVHSLKPHRKPKYILNPFLYVLFRAVFQHTAKVTPSCSDTYIKTYLSVKINQLNTVTRSMHLIAVWVRLCSL